MGDARNVFQITAGKPHGRRSLETPRSSADNIKPHLRKISGSGWVVSRVSTWHIGVKP